MNQQQILGVLTRLEAELGYARVITHLVGIRRPRLISLLEIKGRHDDPWRPLASVQLSETSQPIFTPHFNALPDDTARTSWLFS
jgi:hypothetical protein